MPRTAKTLPLLAAAAALAAAVPATAGAKTKTTPTAHAAGGDVIALIYPSLVKTRVSATRRALKLGVRQIENGKTTKAAATFKVVRRQMAAAWRGAKYIIRTTPPPPPAEARSGPSAQASGGAPVGPTLAAPADTGIMVLSLQHDVAAGVIQLIDGAHGTGLNALSTTLNFTLDARDKAIKDILALAPPAPPAEARSGPSAHASGGAVVGNTFDILMPNTIVDFDDEMQAIDGLTSDATDLTTGGRRLLSAAFVQILRTERVVNAHWPPVPAEA